jgi:hypothetical protein
MLQKRANSKFWLNVAATALLMMVPAWRAGRRRLAWKRSVGTERPFGEPQSSEEPFDVELRRARERDRGRQAMHPLQIPWRGWYDIVCRTYREMQSDRLLSIAGGVSFFVLLAIFPAITALVSAYGLFFSPSTIVNNLSLLNEVMPDNVLNIVHEQASRIASNNGGALSIGIVVGILVSLWSAMSGVKAMIDTLNEQVGLYLFPLAIGNFCGPLLLGSLFDTVGRKKMIAGTFAMSGVLLLVTAYMFGAGLLSATTQTIAWCIIFFFASAAASSAYLTASEIFPLETRALAIACFYALGTAIGGGTSPLLFGWLIESGSAWRVSLGYQSPPCCCFSRQGPNLNFRILSRCIKCVPRPILMSRLSGDWVKALKSQCASSSSIRPSHSPRMIATGERTSAGS